MASPDALLSALGTEAASSKNPLEKLAEAPFPGVEGPAFSIVLQEAATLADGSPDVPAADATADTGKGLPLLPERPLPATRVRVVPAVERNLEEFAVGMGIDRGLARLLLTETAPAMTADAAPAGDAPVAEPAESAADAEVIPPVSPMPMWIAMAVTVEMGVAATNGGGAEPGSTDVPPPRLVATATAPVATPPVLASPIVDEDLLLWRSKLSSAPMNAGLPTVPVDGPAPPPASLPLAPTGEVATKTDPSMPAASTSVRLRARAAVMPVPDLGAAPTAIVVAADSKGAEADMAPANEVRTAVPTDGLKPAGRRATTIMPFTLSGEEGIQSEAPQAGLVRTIAATEFFASASSMTPTAPGDVSATVGEASRTLSTPDPKLSFGERVQAFADAVAQRVLGQIREDDWRVSLQLEPADMGTLDIDLTLRGNAVAATIGVVNGEVRALLESGLPRLRESLESAGLQLAGWTFGQSGSRGFGEPARKLPSQAAYRVRTADVGSVSEAGLPLLNPRKDAGTSAVDLFV